MSRIDKLVRDVRQRRLLEELSFRGLNIRDPKIVDLVNSELESFEQGKDFGPDEVGQLIINLRAKGLTISKARDLQHNVQESNRWLHSKFPDTFNWRLFRITKTKEGD